MARPAAERPPRGRAGGGRAVAASEALQRLAGSPRGEACPGQHGAALLGSGAAGWPAPPHGGGGCMRGESDGPRALSWVAAGVRQPPEPTGVQVCACTILGLGLRPRLVRGVGPRWSVSSRRQHSGGLVPACASGGPPDHLPSPLVLGVPGGGAVAWWQWSLTVVEISS